jgi:hypothetical protein
VVTGVIDIATLTTKKVDFIVEYLREYEVICKKALTRVSGAQMELFDEKNQRSKISWQGPLKQAKVNIIVKVFFRLIPSFLYWYITLKWKRKKLSYLGTFLIITSCQTGAGAVGASSRCGSGFNQNGAAPCGSGSASLDIRHKNIVKNVKDRALLEKWVEKQTCRSSVIDVTVIQFSVT